MNKRLESLIAERDMIGTQLVKKNDELSLQDGKIKMLLITLETGEKQYQQRLEDIRLMRIEIKRLRKEKNLLAKGIENMTDLRLEVFNLERDLNRERQRVRALEEALETPLNVHRWRKLQSTDPTTLELLDKVKILQKKLLNKAQQVQELQKLVTVLRNNMPKEPDRNLKEEVLKAKKYTTEQNEKIKSIKAELHMRETQLTEYKLDLEAAKTEIKILKDKFVQYEKERGEPSVEIPKIEFMTEGPAQERPPLQPISKFFGGGYNLCPTKCSKGTDCTL